MFITIIASHTKQAHSKSSLDRLIVVTALKITDKTNESIITMMFHDILAEIFCAGFETLKLFLPGFMSFKNYLPFKNSDSSDNANKRII